MKECSIAANYNISTANITTDNTYHEYIICCITGRFSACYANGFFSIIRWKSKWVDCNPVMCVFFDNSRVHVQSFSNAVIMSFINDDRYALLWFSSTLKGKRFEFFWSNPTDSSFRWTSARDASWRKFETIMDQRGVLVVLWQLK